MKYTIKLDADAYAGMDDEVATAVYRHCSGECVAKRVSDGYELVASSKNALANGYTFVCGVNTLKEAMAQGDPRFDLSTDEGVWMEFSEYYNVVQD